MRDLDWLTRKKSDSVRKNFLLGLSHSRNKKHWETSTFLDFLNEKLMLDELGFYLHIRSLVFTGPQLGLSMGKYSRICYVPLARIIDIADQVVNIHRSEMLELQANLNKRSRVKGNAAVIDASLALRVVLEYYIREKKTRYIAVRGLFLLSPKTIVNNKETVDFSSFKRICKNVDSEMTDKDVISLYYQCYAMGNGTIDPKVFVLTANETGYFYHALLLRKPSADFLPIKRLYSAHETSISYVKECTANLGVPELLSDFMRYNKASSSTNPTSEQFLFFYYFLLSVPLIYKNPSFKHDLSILPEAFTPFVSHLRSQKLKRLHTQFAIRIIQKNWRRMMKDK